MTPEAKARVDIDKLLAQAGWHVCGMADFNIHAAQGVGAESSPLVEARSSAAGMELGRLARELAGSGARVMVVDRYEIGERQTSACAAPTGPRRSSIFIRAGSVSVLTCFFASVTRIPTSLTTACCDCASRSCE